MNNALLAKWWWQLENSPGKLVNIILKDKYSSRKRSWTCMHRNSSNLSGFWKGLISVKEIFLAALIFKIGDGRRDSFWKDQGCSQTSFIHDYFEIFQLVTNKDATVKDYFSRGSFNVGTLCTNNMLLRGKIEEIKTLLRMGQPLEGTHDTLTMGMV